METVEEFAETIDPFGGDRDASGEVEGAPKSFTIEAEAGNDIEVNLSVRSRGSGERVEVRLYGPDGNQVDRVQFSIISTSVSPREVFTVEESGSYRIEVDPRGDRGMRLGVRITVTDPNE